MYIIYYMSKILINIWMNLINQSIIFISPQMSFIYLTTLQGRIVDISETFILKTQPAAVSHTFTVRVFKQWTLFELVLCTFCDYRKVGTSCLAHSHCKSAIPVHYMKSMHSKVCTKYVKVQVFVHWFTVLNVNLTTLHVHLYKNISYECHLR